MPRCTMTIVACVLSLLAETVAGQAPVVTPKGDPSVRSDTIYRLAVEPDDYPEQPFVYLLDDGIVRFEADGRGTRTYRQVIQILTPEAAENWAEQTFSYLEGRERLRINWIRVLRPDGTIVSDGPSHEQESAAPVPEAYPVYSDLMIRRASLGGVEPGTLVDFSYTTEVLDPMLTGDWSTGWRVTTGRLVRRSRLIVDVPAGIEPRIEERNLDFPRRSYQRNGRQVYIWATADVAAFESEPFAGSPNDVIGGITVSSPLTWEQLGRWYADLARDRYAVSAQLQAKLSEVVKDAGSLEDSLRAVHRWVAQDVRYVSLSLGRGGYQPRRPDDVLATGFGDCKDKATLFVAIAQAFGAVAYPVLVNLDGEPDSLMPSIGQFDHMIAALATPEGYTYLDLTAELIPWGEVPLYLQGEPGLLVRHDGSSLLVRFPEDPPEANAVEYTITGELADDGSFRGRYTQVASGGAEYGLRRSLAGASKLTPEQRSRAALAMANELFEGARGDSLTLVDGRDLRVAPRVSVAVAAPKITQRSGADYILTLPIPTYANPGLAADLESRGPRRFPIDVSEVNGPGVRRDVMEIVLPEGWRAELPPNVAVTGAFGRYTAQYSQEGRRLRIMRELGGGRGLEPPDSLEALIRWVRAVAEDDARYIVIRPG